MDAKQVLAHCDKVKGWMWPKFVSEVLLPIHEKQRDMGVVGNVSEIGIYEGRFFIVLCHLCDPDYTAEGIEVNPVRIEHTKQHCQQWCPGVKTNFINRDSTKLSADDLRHDVKLFSVDGDHSGRVALNDFRLACQCIKQGGIVLVDDWKFKDWPEVSAYIWEAMKKEKFPVVPFYFKWNKCLFAHPGWASTYQGLPKHLSEDWRM